jgi:CTP synthase
MRLSGLSPDDNLVEYIELVDHPFFLGTQAHPEFRSRPDMPHPLFTGLVQAAMTRTGPAIELVETVDLTTE